MDKTEQNIRMCEKAWEIQALRTKDNWQDGDVYATVFRDVVFLVHPIDIWADVPLHVKHRDECIWLPHQDQLQKMVFPSYEKRFSKSAANCKTFRFYDPSFLFRMVIMDFNDWVNETSPSHNPYISKFSSREQLELAFVMKELYHKVWDGNDWIIKEVKD